MTETENKLVNAAIKALDKEFSKERWDVCCKRR